MEAIQPALRPGDVPAAIHIALHPAERYEDLAEGLGLSLSAAHRAVQRLERASLLLPHERRANRSTLLEFIEHGVRFAFPPVLSEETRGVPTATLHPDFLRVLPQGGGAVWPYFEGSVRGPSLVPLYRHAASAALRDPALHRALALVDAIRIGQIRERRIAIDLLKEELARGLPKS